MSTPSIYKSSGISLKSAIEYLRGNKGDEVGFDLLMELLGRFQDLLEFCDEYRLSKITGAANKLADHLLIKEVKFYQPPATTNTKPSDLRQVVIHPKFFEDRFGQVAWSDMPPEKKKELQNEVYAEIDKWLSGGVSSIFFTGGFTDPTTGKFIPYIIVERIS